MKNKITNWYNSPVTWKQLFQMSIWGTIVGTIATYGWLFGVGWIYKKKQELTAKHQMKAEKAEYKKLKKSKYHTVSRDVEE